MYIPIMHIITAPNGNHHEQGNMWPLVLHVVNQFERRIVPNQNLIWRETALYGEALEIYHSNELSTFLEEEETRSEKGDFASSLNTEMPNYPHLPNIRIFWFDKGDKKGYLGFSEIPDQSYTKYLKVIQFINPYTMRWNYFVGYVLHNMIRTILSGLELNNLLPEYMYQYTKHNLGENLSTNFSTNGMKIIVNHSAIIEILQQNVMIIIELGITLDDVFRYGQNGELLMREHVMELIKNLKSGEWYWLIGRNGRVVFQRVPRARLDFII